MNGLGICYILNVCACACACVPVCASATRDFFYFPTPNLCKYVLIRFDLILLTNPQNEIYVGSS